MEYEKCWHTQAITQLSQILERDPRIKALILGGSLASAEIQVDEWSDVDATIILADHALQDYFALTAWLHPLGQLVGAERHQSSLSKTLRIVLDGFRKYDLIFIPESALCDPSLWDDNPLYPAYLVLWSKLPDLEKFISFDPLPAEYQDVPCEEIESMIDAFWFKASVAITKVVRNDLLIGTHLAFDLARDCLVVQMIRRDREKKTVIHRLGGWGNELVPRFSWNSQEYSGVVILDFIKSNCAVFDELVKAILPDYKPRCAFLFPHIESAKDICRVRNKREYDGQVDVN